MPGPAPSVYSPFRAWGIPQANSMTSSPLWMSPRLSASTLPCSEESRPASSSIRASTRRLNSNMTRARRCGLTAAQPACASTPERTAASTSSGVARATRPWVSPVFGSKMSPKRPERPATRAPEMKWSTVRKGGASRSGQDGSISRAQASRQGISRFHGLQREGSARPPDPVALEFRFLRARSSRETAYTFA